MKVHRLGVIALVITLTPTALGIAKAQAPDTEKEVVTSSVFKNDQRHPTKEVRDLALLRAQMKRHPELPSIDFWLAVGRCETGLGVNGKDTWSRGANWPNALMGGALGIASKSTWRGYGGRQFATRPGKASKYAQIIVANRIAFIGFQTSQFLTLADKLANKPFYRPAVGFHQGWGGSCAREWLRAHRTP